MTRSKLEDFLDDLRQVNTLAELKSEIPRLRDILGVDHVIYHSVNSTGEQYAALTYDDAWVARYVEEDLARVDPVVLGCYQRFHPVDWKQLDWTSKSARRFLAEAMEYGVGNQGISVPLRGPTGQFAMFTVNSKADDESWAKFREEHLKDIILVAHFLNQKALEIERGTDQAPSKTLSPREIDALTLIASGQSRAQAAEALSISEHTLRVYIESARFKLGAANTTHAVARAMVEGLIVI